MRLPKGFFVRGDVVAVARDLLGMVLATRLSVDGSQGGKRVLTAVRITETEAYAGSEDRASHAFGNRCTARTRIMYATGGVAYVYLCYGIHCMFNLVTGPAGVPHAVLIRSGEPIEGLETMRMRRGSLSGKALTAGPGRLAAALGIRTGLSGTPLNGNVIWIEDRGRSTPAGRITSATRIGVDYAGEHAARPWRFMDASSDWVTYPRKDTKA